MDEESWGPGSRHAAEAWLHSEKIDEEAAVGGSRPTPLTTSFIKSIDDGSSIRLTKLRQPDL